MKISVLLLCVEIFSLSASVYSQDVRISVRLENKPVSDVFTAIKTQTDYSFWYDVKDVDVHQPVTLYAENETVKTVLSQALKEQDVDFAVYGNHIIIAKKGTLVLQQEITVSGTVTDQNGEPLPGVSVIVKGTTIGISTDADGKYSISIPDREAVLAFSLIGYFRQEAAVGEQTTINVSLVEDTQALDEVVVIGYGSVKKSDLTGSVSSVSNKDFGDVAGNINIAYLLAGKASGVDVAGTTIRIRGVTSLNNTDPLIIVDGFMGGTAVPDDIENIEVLKDASSTAIYGSRGANGVILITTKSGKPGPLKFQANVHTDFNFWPKKWDMLNASEYVDFLTESYSNANLTIPPNLLKPESRIDVTDWQDVLRKTGRQTQANLSFSGGSEKAVYSLFMNYRFGDPSLTIGAPTTNNFVSMRNKFDFKLTKWLKVGTNFYADYSATDGAGQVRANDAYVSAPYIPVLDPANTAGTGYGDSDLQLDGVAIANPLAFAELLDVENLAFNYKPDIWAEIEPVKGLVYRVQAGVSGSFTYNSSWQPDLVYGGKSQNLISTLQKSHSFAFVPLVENYLTWSKVIGKHDFSLMAGNSWQNYVQRGSLSASGTNFADYTIKNIMQANNRQVLSQTFSTGAYLSYYGRVNYQFNNKYLLTANIRADGSPRFAPGNRWGYFPSVAAAWKMHEESWIKNLGVFDQLKLRAGYGESGNDAIGDFRYLSKVHRTAGVYYPLGDPGEKNQGATVRTAASSNIKWESVISRTVGLDMAFLKNRLTATVEYFSKSTNDILFNVPIPFSMGYGASNSLSSGSAIVNAASVTNTGFELVAGYQGNIGKLNYSVNGNYTHVRNRVTSLGDGEPYVASLGYVQNASYAVSRTEIDHPIGYYWGFIADGIFETQAELDAANAAAQAKGFDFYQEAATRPGDVRFRDLNGDGTVDWDNDRTEIGSPIPVHNFGLNLNLSYQGFDFGMQMQGIAGSYLWNSNYGLISSSRAGNKDAYVLNRWKSEQEPGNGKVPRAIIGDPAQNDRPSTLIMQKADYLKIRFLSVGYTLPKNLVQKMGLDNLRIYCAAENLYTFTGFTFGYDPDVNSSGDDNLTRGYYNVTNTPRPRTFAIGIQFGL
ncbi:MAG: TonB-dependent receptor [Tannerella sp.]|nr:TonB-dependent receptor [Tannerella sp.]